MIFEFLYNKIRKKYRKIKNEYKIYIFSKNNNCYFGDEINYTGSLSSLLIGEGTTINSYANLRFKNGEIRIGKKCLIARNVTILTQSYNTDRAKLISSENMYVKDVVIGDGVWIGSNVVIMPGVNIGDYAIVGAGSIVTKNIGDFEIWAGVPAKKIRDRKIDEK